MKFTVTKNVFLPLYREYENWVKKNDELKNEESLFTFVFNVKLSDQNTYNELLILLKNSIIFK